MQTQQSRYACSKLSLAAAAAAVAVCAGLSIAKDQPARPSEKPREASALQAGTQWTTEMAAHLLRRAGFGGTPEQVDYLVKLGRERAVDYLVDYADIPFSLDDPAIAGLGANISLGARRQYRDLSKEQRMQVQQRLRQLQEMNLRDMTNWWLARMVATPRPLEEKMTLFWHGHFTSGIREVKRVGALHAQNELFRSMAVGNFRELLAAVARDPAMLVYLNNNQNRKGKPNENFARELLELFTLGIGNYTERDIKEAARALTGWTVNPANGKFAFARRQHDMGRKTFMGQSGDFDGTNILGIILEQPACAEHLARRLWRYFASEDAPAAVAASLARTLRGADYELKPLLRAMFRCDAFYAQTVMHSHVKSPVELVVGTLRALEVRPDDCTAFAASCRMMGQELFQPPNVKGWDGGLLWINTASLFNRYNLLAYIIYGTPRRPPELARRMESRSEAMQQVDEMLGINADDLPDSASIMQNQPPFDPMAIVRDEKLSTPDRMVNHFVRRLLQRPISAERRQVLEQELVRLGGDLAPDSPRTAEAVRGLIHLIVSMPEYQLN